MATAVVSGLGEYHPRRRSGLHARRLVLMAVEEAMRDAGIVNRDIDGVITESYITPSVLSLNELAPVLRLDGIRYQALSSPMGAGILLAIAQAHAVVEAGLAQHVLTYFGVDWGSSGGGPAGIHASMDAKRAIEYPIGFSGPPVYFATIAHRYAYNYGLNTRQLEELLFEVARSARRNSARHHYAQLRMELSPDEYWNDPYFAQPLRRADISLLSDGAVALIISDADAVAPERRTVTLEGWAHTVHAVTDQAFYTQDRELPKLEATAAVAERIKEDTGQDVANADVFELYDCFSIATVLQLESLGITKPGMTAEVVHSGSLDFDGSTPTNTHGGLLAHGYTLGASHVAEAIRQLRGEALGNSIADVSTAFVGAGPGRQYTGLLYRRIDG